MESTFAKKRFGDIENPAGRVLAPLDFFLRPPRRAVDDGHFGEGRPLGCLHITLLRGESGDRLRTTTLHLWRANPFSLSSQRVVSKNDCLVEWTIYIIELTINIFEEWRAEPRPLSSHRSRPTPIRPAGVTKAIKSYRAGINFGEDAL